jgi:hypothetical protein
VRLRNRKRRRRAGVYRPSEVRPSSSSPNGPVRPARTLQSRRDRCRTRGPTRRSRLVFRLSHIRPAWQPCLLILTFFGVVSESKNSTTWPIHSMERRSRTGTGLRRSGSRTGSPAEVARRPLARVGLLRARSRPAYCVPSCEPSSEILPATAPAGPHTLLGMQRGT